MNSITNSKYEIRNNRKIIISFTILTMINIIISIILIIIILVVIFQ